MLLMLVNMPCDDKTLHRRGLKRSAKLTNVVDDESSDAGSEGEDQSSIGEISDAGDSSDPFVDHLCVFLLMHLQCWMLISC